MVTVATCQFPVSFDVAAEEIFPTLLAGATLVLPPDPLGIAAERLSAFAERQGLTVLNLPSPYWHIDHSNAYAIEGTDGLTLVGADETDITGTVTTTGAGIIFAAAGLTTVTGLVT